MGPTDEFNLGSNKKLNPTLIIWHMILMEMRLRRPKKFFFLHQLLLVTYLLFLPCNFHFGFHILKIRSTIVFWVPAVILLSTSISVAVFYVPTPSSSSSYSPFAASATASPSPSSSSSGIPVPSFWGRTFSSLVCKEVVGRVGWWPLK